MKKKKERRRTSYLILRIHLPLVTTVLIGILIAYLRDRAIDPLLANSYYPGMLEHVVAGIAILLGGALLAEAMDRERDGMR